MPREFHVAKNGRPGAPGTAAHPLLSIQAAAELAMPGDAVIVHAGVYRERIDPPRGGSSDSARITFSTAPGEHVEIRGSELVKGWTPHAGQVWTTRVPHSLFGDFNPFADRLRGDWFNPKGRPHHTGAVYLDGLWFSEAASLDEVLHSTESVPLWFAKVQPEATTLWARFGPTDPNHAEVEINVRRTVFYPSRPGINYLTVRGFTLRHAATPWAPPTAEQIGLLGTHWSRGWIIEHNTVSDSICCGIALGKYGDAWDNQSANTAEGYNETIARALLANWRRGEVGHHLVRGNTITRCEQAGIVGSLGAAFSEISGNHVHHIWTKRLFEGEEMAGIKLHGAIDTLIKGNHVHHSGRGLWLDWMSQGVRVSANLLHSNSVDDLFLEVNHGPLLVDNNLLLSPVSLRDWSEGGAYVHNLFAGKISVLPQHRRTPFHHPHSTALLGIVDFQRLDNRYFNNVFVGHWPSGESDSRFEYGRSGYGLWPYDEYPASLTTGGNLYCRGARPSRHETDAAELPGLDPSPRLAETAQGLVLSLRLDPLPAPARTRPVTTASIGLAAVPKAPFVHPDGSPLALDTDYLGQPRTTPHPAPGPFEDAFHDAFTAQVWPPSNLRFYTA
jgi:alpha-N-arabinofuranosidase